MAVEGGNAIDHGKAYPGMIADLQLCNTVTGIVEQTDGIPFGYAVVRNTTPGAVVLPGAASTAGDFVGVTRYELNRAYFPGQTFGAVENESASIVTMGVIWVLTVGGATAGGAVFMGIGTNIAGQFTNAAGTGVNEAVGLPNVKFLDTVTTGQLARISLVVGG